MICFRRESMIMLQVIFALIISSICNFAFAERDWEYWSQEAFSIPVNDSIIFLVNTEWKFKNDMHKQYSFKTETGPSFKLNKYFNTAFFYVYQEKKSGSLWDRSDLIYLDGIANVTLGDLLELKISNRLRYQYDFDKDKTTWRNSLKFSKTVRIAKLQITPYLSEEPFYDTKLDRVTEHRTASGITLGLNKNFSIGFSYMLNSKKSRTEWSYANVFISNLSIRF